MTNSVSQSKIPFSARLLKWWALHGISTWDKQSAFRKCRRFHRGLTIIINTLDHFEFKIVIGDSVDTHLFVYGEFEPAISAIIRERASHSHSFIDIGCNIGYYSCLFGKYCPQNSTILAMDANPEMVQRCQENIVLNRLNAKVLSLGVADKPGKLRFNLDRRRPSKASFGKSEKSGNMTAMEVDVAPLSDIMHQEKMSRVDLIKIDIEGFEPALFNGLRAEDAVQIGCLVFEYEHDHMKRCGFEPDEIWIHSYWDAFDLFGLIDTSAKPIQITRNSIPYNVKTILAINRSS
jgi:FkbM family methyltransferase